MTDWPLITMKLISHYKTQKNLSMAVKISTTSLSELVSGRTQEPRHAAGERLLQAYRRAGL